MRRLSPVWPTVLLLVAAASAQQTIEISEPGVVALSDLFKQADVVAVVHILSGDSESYDSAVYKSKVLTQFKGTAVNDDLYFGPFIGYGVGNEYVAFLRRAKSGPTLQAQRSTNNSIAYGAVEVLHLIMYQGYSIMPIRYVCVFEGKDPSQSCDYGVRVNTQQVKLPKGIKTFPRASDDEFVDASRWVRKDDFLRLLTASRQQTSTRQQ
jgi:hypothetical protein